MGALLDLILLTLQNSPITCSLYTFILCMLCICFVSVPYAYATCGRPKCYVNKDMFCSVLFNKCPNLTGLHFCTISTIVPKILFGY